VRVVLVFGFFVFLTTTIASTCCARRAIAAPSAGTAAATVAPADSKPTAAIKETIGLILSSRHSSDPRVIAWTAGRKWDAQVLAGLRSRSSNDRSRSVGRRASDSGGHRRPRVGCATIASGRFRYARNVLTTHDLPRPNRRGFSICTAQTQAGISEKCLAASIATHEPEWAAGFGKLTRSQSGRGKTRRPILTPD
jgi:hypothetical protein